MKAWQKWYYPLLLATAGFGLMPEEGVMGLVFKGLELLFFAAAAMVLWEGTREGIRDWWRSHEDRR